MIKMIKHLKLHHNFYTKRNIDIIKIIFEKLIVVSETN